ncbi:MAG: thioredoxin family protein [Planctomycetaceae bacterium]|nr:thioredoxin family protein [Planctomycetaceae bacterium]
MSSNSTIAGFSRLRILALLAALLVASNQASADELPWSTDIEGALQQAASTGRPVLMEFTAEWCVYCKRMEKNTFTDPAVAQAIRSSFIPVRVDADQYKDLVKQLQIKGLPAILVVAPDLAILERISGFQTPEALIKKLARFQQPLNSAAPSAQFASANPAAAAQPTHRVSSTNGFNAVPASQPEPVRSPSPQQFAAQTAAPQPQQSNNELPNFDLFAGVPHAESGVRPAVPQPAIQAAEQPNPFSQESFDAFVDSQQTSAPQPSAIVSANTAAPAPQNAFEDATFEWNTPAANPSAQNGATGTLASDERAQVSANPFQLSSQTREQTDRLIRPSFGGICLVSALDDRAIVRGQLKVGTVYRNKRIVFHSPEYRDRFLANPEKYWPMLDGICSVTLAQSGKQIEGRFEYASVFRNRVWLFTNEQNMNLFLEEPAEVVEEALEQL